MTIAARLSKYASRTDEQLTVGSTATYASEMALRGGRTKNAAVQKWPAAEQKDIGDRMHILAHEIENLPDEFKAKFDKKNEDTYAKFNAKEARKWAKITNGLVQYRANRRRNDTV